MRRVLLVGKGPPDTGGIAAFLQILLNSDLRARHDLRLLNLYRSDVLHGGRFTSANIAETLADAGRVWRGSRSADIVHINIALVPLATLLRTGLLALSARLGGAQVIVHVHSGVIELWLTTRARRMLARLMLLPARRIITVSQSSRAPLAASVGVNRLVVIPNGVDVSAYGPAEPSHNPPRILFAGVISPRKGVVDLLQASGILHARGVAHEVLLAGGPPAEGPRPEAEARLAAATNGAPARFLGPQRHEAMAALYRSADLFCLPSWIEAMPLTILEAMATGLPVVATPVGDIGQVVEDGVSGRLVPVRAPEALANALEPLLSQPPLRRAMGKAARQRVQERFDITKMCASVEAVYRDL